MTGLLGSQTLEVRFRGSQPDARGCRHLPQWGPQTSSRAWEPTRGLLHRSLTACISMTPVSQGHFKDGQALV